MGFHYAFGKTIPILRVAEICPARAAKGFLNFGPIRHGIDADLLHERFDRTLAKCAGELVAAVFVLLGEEFTVLGNLDAAVGLSLGFKGLALGSGNRALDQSRNLFGLEFVEGLGMVV